MNKKNVNWRIKYCSLIVNNGNFNNIKLNLCDEKSQSKELDVLFNDFLY